MKTYFISKINNLEVAETATSIKELESVVLAYSFKHGFDERKIYVYCSHICYGTTDEQNVEYIVRSNGRTQAISTRRI